MYDGIDDTLLESRIVSSHHENCIQKARRRCMQIDDGSGINLVGQFKIGSTISANGIANRLVYGLNDGIHGVVLQEVLDQFPIEDTLVENHLMHQFVI